MIEIKELIIRAIVDTSAEKPKDANTGNSGRSVNNDVFAESIDQVLEIIREKDER